MCEGTPYSKTMKWNCSTKEARVSCVSYGRETKGLCVEFQRCKWKRRGIRNQGWNVTTSLMLVRIWYEIEGFINSHTSNQEKRAMKTSRWGTREMSSSVPEANKLWTYLAKYPCMDVVLVLQLQLLMGCCWNRCKSSVHVLADDEVKPILELIGMAIAQRDKPRRWKTRKQWDRCYLSSYVGRC